MSEKKCLTCVFRIIGENKGGARCHRFPPQGYNPGTARAIFPVVQDGDVCGEWKTLPKKPTKAKPDIKSARPFDGGPL